MAGTGHRRRPHLAQRRGLDHGEAGAVIEGKERDRSLRLSLDIDPGLEAADPGAGDSCADRVHGVVRRHHQVGLGKVLRATVGLERKGAFQGVDGLRQADQFHHVPFRDPYGGVRHRRDRPFGLGGRSLATL